MLTLATAALGLSSGARFASRGMSRSRIAHMSTYATFKTTKGDFKAEVRNHRRPDPWP